MRRLVVALLAGAASAVAWAQPSTLGVPQGEPPKPWQESGVTLPGPPREADLVAVHTTGASSFRFFVDRRSVSVGDDGVVRYTVVAVSGEGARNVSYEGLRCAKYERRVYALGRGAAGWGPASSSEWREFSRTAGTYYGLLYRDFFCPNGSPIASAREGVDALVRGMNPRAIGSMP